MDKKREIKKDKEWTSIGVTNEVKQAIVKLARNSEMKVNTYLRKIFIKHPELLNTQLISNLTQKKPIQREGGRTRK